MRMKAVAITFSKVRTSINMSELLSSMVRRQMERILTEIRFAEKQSLSKHVSSDETVEHAV